MSSKIFIIHNFIILKPELHNNTHIPTNTKVSLTIKKQPDYLKHILATITN